MSDFLNYTLSLGALKQEGKTHTLQASNEDCHIVTKRFSIGTFEKIEFFYSCQKIQETYIDLDVIAKADVLLTCSSSGKQFNYPLQKKFILRFTPEKNIQESDDEINTDPLIYKEPISSLNEKVHLGEIFLQYLSLLLPDYPYAPGENNEKQTKEHYLLKKENPFTVLKGLKR